MNKTFQSKSFYTSLDGGANSMGTSPHFYKGTVSRTTASKKLKKLYWPSRKRSPKRLIVLLEQKKVEGHNQKKFPGAGLA